jgi:hypothetical protein
VNEVGVRVGDLPLLHCCEAPELPGTGARDAASTQQALLKPFASGAAGG